MIEITPLQLILSSVAGFVIAALFFGGLWLTVQCLVTSRHPAVLMIASLSLRFGLLVTACYWLINGIHWQALIVAMIVFTITRAGLVHAKVLT